MIVFFYFLLIGICEEVGGDGFWLVEIKVGVSNIFQFVIWDIVVFYWQIFLGEDLELMLVYIVLFIVEVEIDVIGYIYWVGLVYGGVIGNCDVVIVGQMIVCGGLQGVWKVLIVIG